MTETKQGNEKLDTPDQPSPPLGPHPVRGKPHPWETSSSRLNLRCGHRQRQHHLAPCQEWSCTGFLSLLYKSPQLKGTNLK